MKIRDKRLAVFATACLGLWVLYPVSAFAESAPAKKSSDAPIVLSKFNKQKTHAAEKSKTKSAHAGHGAKLADAAARGKTSNSGDALKNLALFPSVANAHAELTMGNPQSQADDEARNIAATDDSDIVVMNGVQIASADQLNDIDRAMTDDKTEVKADDTATAAPAAQQGRIIRAVPSGERHVFKNGDSSPWSSTSLIGKIFVAFGSLLTLASAARLMMA